MIYKITCNIFRAEYLTHVYKICAVYTTLKAIEHTPHIFHDISSIATCRVKTGNGIMMYTKITPHDGHIDQISITSFTRLEPVNVQYVGDFLRGFCYQHFHHAYMFIN